jgi:SAM-dependent methyltransferase
MSGYTDFARFYDRFTSNVDYGARARYFDAVIQKYNPGAQLLLDLACGTGSLSFELEKFGYDIAAVDDSYEMLSVAAQKRGELGSGVLFLCQEMSMLDLFGTVQATVCALDSVNHVTDKNELLEVFKKVSLFSEKNAVFVFDVNTVYKHQKVLANNSFVFENGDTLCAWRNALEDDGLSVDISLDFFDKDAETGLYERFCTDFSERAYEIEELKEMLKKAGFEFRAVFDEDSFLPLRSDSERAVIVATKI